LQIKCVFTCNATTSFVCGGEDYVAGAPFSIASASTLLMAERITSLARRYPSPPGGTLTLIFIVQLR
jgi:hypothetical protein